MVSISSRMVSISSRMVSTANRASDLVNLIGQYHLATTLKCYRHYLVKSYVAFHSDYSIQFLVVHKWVNDAKYKGVYNILEYNKQIPEDVFDVVLIVKSTKLLSFCNLTK